MLSRASVSGIEDSIGSPELPPAIASSSSHVMKSGPFAARWERTPMSCGGRGTHDFSLGFGALSLGPVEGCDLEASVEFEVGGATGRRGSGSRLGGGRVQPAESAGRHARQTRGRARARSRRQISRRREPTRPTRARGGAAYCRARIGHGSSQSALAASARHLFASWGCQHRRMPSPAISHAHTPAGCRAPRSHTSTHQALPHAVRGKSAPGGCVGV